MKCGAIRDELSDCKLIYNVCVSCTCKRQDSATSYSHVPTPQRPATAMFPHHSYSHVPTPQLQPCSHTTATAMFPHHSTPINNAMQIATQLHLAQAVVFPLREMKSEHTKTNDWRQARSQLHLSAGVATKREQYVTDLSQLHTVPEVWLLTTLGRQRPWPTFR
jgi:hypothetical protein